jgi:hypothetical protein
MSVNSSEVVTQQFAPVEKAVSQPVDTHALSHSLVHELRSNPADFSSTLSKISRDTAGAADHALPSFQVMSERSLDDYNTPKPKVPKRDVPIEPEPEPLDGILRWPAE